MPVLANHRRCLAGISDQDLLETLEESRLDPMKESLSMKLDYHDRYCGVERAVIEVVSSTLI
jgi:hypothetical protein